VSLGAGSCLAPILRVQCGGRGPAALLGPLGRASAPGKLAYPKAECVLGKAVLWPFCQEIELKIKLF